MTTLKDIASRAGVSTATVSCVLNNTRFVSHGLRARVMAVVEETNYRPNRLARSLRLKRTNTIGLIVTNVLNPFYTEIARAVEDRAGQLGLTVVLCNSDDRAEKERQYAELMRDKQVDGLLIAPALGDHSYLRSLLDDDYPLVLVNRTVPDLAVSTVTVDNERAAYMATQHLAEHGHSRIGALLANSGSQLSNVRRRGYERALAEHGLPVSNALAADGLSTLEGGLAVTKQLLRSEDPPTAIVSLSTLMTIGALRAFREMGVRCPEEVALVGFGETLWNPIADPPVSSIAQPARDIGAGAVDLLESLIARNHAGEPVSRVLSCQLIPRRSCGCQEPSSSVPGDVSR